MADKRDSSLAFFSKATSSQWSFVLSLYKEVLKVRAHQTRGSKKGGPQELIKLDNWYQEQLPKIIQSRKDRHIIHEELVQITKWKLWRGKNRARLLDLVRINTETSVLQISKKAFKKLPNLNGAITALTNLKGIGPATASAVLAAGAPEYCPYMADESMLATPGIEATDYTVSEYLNFSEQIKNCCEKLKAQDPNGKWNPHKIELALWTHYWIKQMKLPLLDSMPLADGTIPEIKEDGDSKGENLETNGSGEKLLDEDSNISVPVSNASEQDEKSNDSSSQEASKRSCGKFRRPEGNGNSLNCTEDSKDGLGPISEENSNNLITNEEYSNLSYSNLSCEDINSSSTVDNTDSEANDGHQVKKARLE